MPILPQTRVHDRQTPRRHVEARESSSSQSFYDFTFTKKNLAQRLRDLALLNARFSHDLRNLFQPLMMVPELLTYRTDDPHLHQLAKIVAECGRHGSALTETMLSLTRGSVTAHERVWIHEVFQRVTLLLQSNLPANVTLHVRRHAKTMAVVANKTQLQQCLINLGLNAIQAMPHGGHVFFSATSQQNHRVCLSVEDTGIGIDKEARDHLFEPFFTTKANGTGLGLLSCKHIADSHGGELCVSARMPHGTRFDLFLPLKEMSPSSRMHHQAASSLQDGSDSNARC